MRTSLSRSVLAPLFAMFAIALPVVACGAPQEVAISYNVIRGGITIAVVNERYEAKDGAFHITSDSSAVGLFALFQPRPARFSSSGRVGMRGLQPERFEAGRGSEDPRRVAAEFDWGRARLTMRHDGREDVLQLPAGTQDRLSVMYQFMFTDFSRMTTLEFPMTNGRKLDVYRYAVIPGVEIETALGRLATVHLVRRRDPGDPETEVWLSPAHAHLPVRMVVVESNGARYEQAVARIEVRL